MKRVIETEKFDVESSKIAKDYSIALLGDLHTRCNTKSNFIDDILQSVIETNPNFIIIDGDLVFSIRDFYKRKVSSKLEHTISELRNIAPVFIVPGNHDILETSRYKLWDAIKYFNKLDSISNTQVLFNTKTKYDGINIIGFSPREKTYHYPHKDKWIDMFSEDFLECDYDLEPDEFNLLATHSPQIISNPDLITKLESELLPLDLIVSAHMHDGLVKKSKQESDIGYSFNDILSILKLKLGKEHFCRGMHDVLNSKLIITRGVRKWVLNNVLFDAIDSKKSHDITNIKLLKK